MAVALVQLSGVETVTSKLNTGNLSEEATRFLAALMEARCNLLVSGDLLTDKTACLTYLEGLIPAGRRVLHVEAGENRAESTTEDWIDQVREARPEHVIVPNWHAGNFLDVLRLIGASRGVVTAIHAKGHVRGALAAIELLAAQTAPNLAQETVREHVGAEFAVGIHTESMEDGSVTIRLISEFQGMEGNVIVLQDIFLPMDTAGRMKLRPTGIRPRLLYTLAEHGIDLPETIFESGLSPSLRRW